METRTFTCDGCAGVKNEHDLFHLQGSKAGLPTVGFDLCPDCLASIYSSLPQAFQTLFAPYMPVQE